MSVGGIFNVEDKANRGKRCMRLHLAYENMIFFKSYGFCFK